MRFGKSWEDVQSEPTSSGGAGFMKWFKKGDTTFRILQEPKDWVGYWEHFNPGGFPFPCNQEDRPNCPGCQSDNERMRKASRRVAVNVLEGTEVNVYKMPKTVADKLDNRAKRQGTIMDRDYTISRIDGRNSDGSTKTDYDIEGGSPSPVPVDGLQLRDIEPMLAAAYEEAWGTSDRAMVTRDNNDQLQKEQETKAKLRAQKGSDETPPFDSSSDPGNTYHEDELRRMGSKKLWDIVLDEKLTPPKNWKDMSANDIVDWMMEQS